MQHVGFCDIATTSGRFVLAIGHADKDGKAHATLTVCTPPFDSKQAIARFAEQLREKGITSVMGPRHSSRWILDAFSRCGIHYEFCNLVRNDLHRDFRAMLEAKKVVVPEHAELRHQVRALTHFKRENGAAGDDLLTAVAGASLLAMGKVKALVESAEADYA